MHPDEMNTVNGKTDKRVYLLLLKATISTESSKFDITLTCHILNG